MSLQDFIPRRDGDLDSMEDNFTHKLPVHGPTLGIDAAEITDTTAIITTHRTSYTDMVSKKAVAQAAVQTNNINKAVAVKEIRRMAKKCKSSNGYTDSIGRDLGIVGPEFIMPDPHLAKPEIKAYVTGSEVIVLFEKLYTDGVRIYSKRGSETAFTFLAIDTSSPYNDNRPKLVLDAPEERSYYAFYFMDDSEIGLQSDIVKAIVP